LGGRNQKDHCSSSALEKVGEIPSQLTMLGIVAHACHPSYTRNIIKGIVVQESLGINSKSYLKNN
jgi:hypothetical protein